MIHLRRPGTWDDLNDQIKKTIATSHAVRFYRTTAQALLETVIGFQTLYSHKRQFYVHLGLGTHADEALLFLSRQGIKALDVFSEPTIDEKKTLFCLLDMDDAITAEIYRSRYSGDDKVFHIRLFHHLHHFEKLPEINETDICIFHLGNQGALVLSGRRGASLPVIAASSLDSNGLAPFLWPPQKRLENQEWVRSVETGWAEGTSFSLSTDRIYDRALLYWSDLEGEALRRILVQEAAVLPHQVESLSLSRWNELKLISQFEKRGWSAESFRGTLLLSAELSQIPDFKKKLEENVRSLRAQSQIN